MAEQRHFHELQGQELLSFLKEIYPMDETEKAMRFVFAREVEKDLKQDPQITLEKVRNKILQSNPGQSLVDYAMKEYQPILERQARHQKFLEEWEASIARGIKEYYDQH
jgi:hypothetical protein